MITPYDIQRFDEVQRKNLAEMWLWLNAKERSLVIEALSMGIVPQNLINKWFCVIAQFTKEERNIMMANWPTLKKDMYYSALAVYIDSLY